MRSILVIIFLISTSFGFAQVPDYSNLSRKDKLKYMNTYGFVILKSKDTILAKVDFKKYSNTPMINSSNELILDYPDELEIYSYQNRIPLESIETFYYGFPRLFNVVKQCEGRFVNLETIEEGKYMVYKKVTESGGGTVMTMPSSQGLGTPMQTGPTVITTLYISKNEGELVCIDGDNEQKRLKLAKLLEGELNAKKLSKLKTRNVKVIELFKKINAK